MSRRGKGGLEREESLGQGLEHIWDKGRGRVDTDGAMETVVIRGKIRNHHSVEKEGQEVRPFFFKG